MTFMRPSRRVADGIAAAVCGLALVGCGTSAAVISHSSWRSTTASASPATPAQGPNEPSPSDKSHRARGAVHGQVLRPPGLDPRSGASNSGTPVPVNGDPVQVHNLGGQVIAAAVTKSGGLFSIVLPPGEYRVVEGICGVGKWVSVRSGSSTHIILTIPSAC
jgi:hypothetical protein